MLTNKASTLKSVLMVVFQVVLISLVWMGANAISSRYMPSLPGGVLGMVILLLALSFGFLPLSWCKQGANWLLAEMLLFFIPAVVAIVQFSSLIESAGIRIMGVIVVSTALVMVATSLAVDTCYKFVRWSRIRRLQRQEA